MLVAENMSPLVKPNVAVCVNFLISGQTGGVVIRLRFFLTRHF